MYFADTSLAVLGNGHYIDDDDDKDDIDDGSDDDGEGVCVYNKTTAAMVVAAATAAAAAHAAARRTCHSVNDALRRDAAFVAIQRLESRFHPKPTPPLAVRGRTLLRQGS
jgi:hypothetical protein